MRRAGADRAARGRRSDGPRRAARRRPARSRPVDHRRAPPAARAQPPAWSASTASRTAWPPRGAACRSTPPEPTTSRTSRRSRPRSAPAATPGVPPHRHRRRQRGDPPVHDPLGVAVGHEPGSSRPAGRRRLQAGSPPPARQPLVPPRPRTTPRGRSTACPGHPRRCGPATACRRRPAPAPSSARPSGVSTEYTSVVAPPTSTTSRSPPSVVGEQLHPGQHRVRGGRPDQRREPRARATAACRRSRAAGTPPGSPPAPAPGRSTPMRGSTLSVTVTGTPAAGSSAVSSSRTSALPASTTGTRQPGPGQPARVVQQHRRRRRRRCRRPAAPRPGGRPAARPARPRPAARPPRAPPARPADSPTRCPACAVTSDS